MSWKSLLFSVNEGHPNPIVTDGRLCGVFYSLPRGVATRLFPNYFGFLVTFMTGCWLTEMLQLWASIH